MSESRKYKNKETGKIHKVSFWVDVWHGVQATVFDLKSGGSWKNIKFSKFILLYEGVINEK